MRIESKYYVKVKIDPLSGLKKSIYEIFSEMDAETVEKFPEVFEAINIELFETTTNTNGLNPTEASFSGNILADSPKKYATTKQLINMQLIKFKKKYNLIVDSETSNIEINKYSNKHITNHNLN